MALSGPTGEQPAAGGFGGFMGGLGNWLRDPNAQFAMASMGQAISPQGSMMQGVATNLMPMLQAQAQMQAADKAQKMWMKYFTELFGPPKPGPAPIGQGMQVAPGQVAQPAPMAMQTPQAPTATVAEQALGATPGQVLAGGGGFGQPQGTFPFL